MASSSIGLSRNYAFCSSARTVKASKSVTVHMDVAPERVWALVRDITNTGRFSPETSEAEWLNGSSASAVDRGISPPKGVKCAQESCTPPRRIGGLQMVQGARRWSMSGLSAVRAPGVAVALLFAALVLLPGLGSVAAGALVGVPLVSARSESQCSAVVGAPFNYKAVGGKQLSGDRYEVLALNEPCSTARTWVAKLTHARPGTANPDGARKLAGGPSGWTCEGKGYTYATHKAPTISGQCYRGKLTNPTQLFYWASSVS
jgi:hypothetical protein